MAINTPVDVVTVLNSTFNDSRIVIHGNEAMQDYGKTQINLVGCVFAKPGEMELLTNEVNGKEIILKTTSNIELHDNFVAKVNPGGGKINIKSDLTGLSERTSGRLDH